MILPNDQQLGSYGERLQISYPKPILCVGESLPDEYQGDPISERRGMRSYRFRNDIDFMEMWVSPMSGTFKVGEWYRFTIEYEPAREEPGRTREERLADGN